MIPFFFAVIVSLAQPARDAVLSLDIQASGGGPARVVEVQANSRRFPLTVYPDSKTRKYSVLLTGVPAGRMEINAPGLKAASMQPIDDPVARHSPFLSPRAGTLEANSDLPLLMYCESLDNNRLLEYTVIFTNEDGGTSTRRLVARWGRTSDIEYIYRVYLDASGRAVRRTYQAKDHMETDFAGPMDGDHALLTVTTRNNMVSPGATEKRFQLAPVKVDLAGRSRESVMDAEPWTHQAAATELVAEKKLRPYGVTEGENISDLRNYLFVDFGVQRTEGAAVALHIRRKGDRVGYTSHLGRSEASIDRDGQVRVGVELPPGTTIRDIEEIGFECVLVPVKREWPHSGKCTVSGIAKAFFLDQSYAPPATGFESRERLELTSGQTGYIRVSR